MSTTSRMKIYKNNSKCNDDLRRKREEEGIQLRKKKKDEQVAFGNYIFSNISLFLMVEKSFHFLTNRFTTHSA